LKVQHLKSSFLFLTLVCLSWVFISCASRSPKLDNNVPLGPIEEYDKKVAIKPLGTTTPVDEKKLGKHEDVTNVPKLGLEPTPKIEIKGKQHKKKNVSGEKPVVTEVATDVDGAKNKHMPEIEDTEGFEGRRPVVDPFHVGEKVTLMLTYFGVSAGDTTLEVKPFVELNGRKAYHFYSQMKSSSVFSMFYKVDDFGESYMDYDQMVPLTFTLSAVETKQLREARQFFDWKIKKASFWERRVTKESGVEEHKKEWDLLPFSQNIYTAVQYARTFQLRDGKTYVYHVSDDGRAWDVRATVVRREILKTDIGTFKTIVIKPEVATEGVLKAMGEVFFWYTDDDRHFLVKFEAKIKIGKVIGYLKALDKGT
jgi:hypothetical protein